MSYLVEEYFKYYSSFAPKVFNNDIWALLFLLSLFGLISQGIVSLYFVLFKKIKDPKRRIKFLTTATAILISFLLLGFSWNQDKLGIGNFITCMLMGVFIWSLQFADKLFGKEMMVDFKSDLNLKNQENKKGVLQCPGCSSFTIASLNIGHCPQTCGECERVIFLEQSCHRKIQYFMGEYGLLIFTFLFMKFSLNIWNNFFQWLFFGIFIGGMIILAIYPEKLKARSLKIKSPSSEGP